MSEHEAASGVEPQLPVEIWAQIVPLLERPKPKLGIQAWSELHQQDLATMMRVTAPILYREPIVGDVLSFLDCYNSSSTTCSVPTQSESHTYDNKETDNPTMADSLPIPSTKALCFQYAQRLHVIVSETTKFSYIASLFPPPYDLDTSVAPVKSKQTSIQTPFTAIGASIYATQPMYTYQAALSQLSQAIQHDPTYHHLRPSSISFGAYGDIVSNRSWLSGKQDQRALINRWSLECSASMRLIWDNFPRQNHCSRFPDGPFNLSYQPTFHPRPTNIANYVAMPKTTYFHLGGQHSKEVLLPITVGIANIIVYHPSDFYTIRNKLLTFHLWDQVIELEDKVMDSIRQGDLSKEFATRTTIDVYASLHEEDFAALRGNFEHFQAQLDPDVDDFKANIKLHPYEDAPPCPSCGWKLESAM